MILQALVFGGWVFSEQVNIHIQNIYIRPLVVLCVAELVASEEADDKLERGGERGGGDERSGALLGRGERHDRGRAHGEPAVPQPQEPAVRVLAVLAVGRVSVPPEVS